MKPSGLDHIAIGVSNLTNSIQWYKDVIGLEPVSYEEWGTTPVVMSSENGSGIALFEADQNIIDSARNLPHIAFKVDAEAYINYKNSLDQKDISYKEDDYVICYSLFIRDPDEYLIELTCYR